MWNSKKILTIRKGQPLELEALETRCVLDGSLPSTFGSADALRDYLITRALDQYKDLFGKTIQGGPIAYYNPVANPAAGVPVSFTQASASLDRVNSQGLNFSGTNVQVAAVDEADIVKTDGDFIYHLSGQQLYITKASPADQFALVSHTPVDGNPVAEYLDGDRLMVISYISSWNNPVLLAGSNARPIWYPSPDKTKVTIFDVSHRDSPKVLQSTYFDGSYLESRAIDHFVYLVAQNYTGFLPAPAYTYFNGVYQYETKDSYLAHVAGEELDLALPHYYHAADDHTLVSDGLMVDPAQLYKPTSNDQYALLSELTFDLNSNVQGPASETSLYAGYGAVLYVSTSNLYFVTANWSNTPETSTIYQFGLDGAQITLKGLGTIQGRVMNSFDLDELNGQLRVVTTSGWSGNQLSSQVFVLQNHDGSLDRVGELDNLAPGESLESVRFVDDRAYVVTFKYTDPLFIIDLSDSAHPAVAGTLVVPGYSSYLHPIDATHLIGIGRSSNINWNGLKLSLFDVTDASNPKEISNYEIRTDTDLYWGWTSSPAEWDHHAFSYFADTHTLAIPVFGTVYSGNYNDNVSSLWVFNVSLDSGFHVRGEIKHDSWVQRSVEIGDTIYSIATDSIQLHSVQSPGDKGQEVRYVDLPRFPDFSLNTASKGSSISGDWATFVVSNQAGLTANVSVNGSQALPASVRVVDDDHIAVQSNAAFNTSGQNNATIQFMRDGQQVASFTHTVNVSVPASQYVDALYHDLLHRARAAGSETGWDSLLTQQGISRSMVAQGILQSHEARGIQLNDLYMKYLGRNADSFGLSSWLNALNHGTTMDQVAAGILGSDEYFARQGGTEQGFLQHLYLDILQRGIDGSGSAAWTQALHNGIGRGMLAMSILKSDEANSRIVQLWYTSFLHRQADAGGLQFWADQLHNGSSKDSVLANIIGSEEYLGLA